MEQRISLDLANHYYYIYLPSNQGQVLFPSVFAYDKWLAQLSKLPHIKIIGYTLFSNNAHLLVHSSVPPSQWLEPFLMEYNNWHQHVTGTSGYLFDDEQQWHALVQPKHLPRMLKWLHYLPVTHKHCSAPQQYVYSSFHDYMAKRQTGVFVDTVLTTISPHFGQRVRRFFDYMTGDIQDIVHIKRHEYYQAFASQRYITQALSAYQLPMNNEYNDEQWHPVWQQCLESLAVFLDLDHNHLLRRSKHHKFVDAHFILAWAFVHAYNGPIYYIAKQLGLDEASIRLNLKSIELHHTPRFLNKVLEHIKSPQVA